MASGLTAWPPEAVATISGLPGGQYPVIAPRLIEIHQYLRRIDGKLATLIGMAMHYGTQTFVGIVNLAKLSEQRAGQHDRMTSSTGVRRLGD